MSHRQVYLTTAALLLLHSPVVLAQSIPSQGASTLQPEPQTNPSRLAQTDETSVRQTESPAWENQAVSNLRLRQVDLGLRLTQGQRYGNKGPASEEQGIQLQFFSQ